jgi:DNA mismatch repair protein MutS
VVKLREVLEVSKSGYLKSCARQVLKPVDGVIELVESKIVDEPPVDVKVGRMFKRGVSEELDELREHVGDNKQWILRMEARERKRTEIGSLKIKFNKVFGYYIEVSKANLGSVPSEYMRKQTMVNAERFVTPELKEKEELILTAQEKINELEYGLFLEILEQVVAEVEAIQLAAYQAAKVDCVLGFAVLAMSRQYCRPKISENGRLRITRGRHPVVEQLDDEISFVPNDVCLECDKEKLWLLTGPNMAGKSVFIRQVALIALMAHMGSFVPAGEAEISLVDRIFVRSGASDVITSGLSTFMVEMVETAHILHHATERSLIVMDEIGRGTSTYDGISIAWSIAEYIVSSGKVGAKTLFATHYHELQELEDCFPEEIRNYHLAIKDDKGEPVFLYQVRRGGASDSFGVAVAKLAGLPGEVVERARELERGGKVVSSKQQVVRSNCHPRVDANGVSSQHRGSKSDKNKVSSIKYKGEGSKEENVVLAELKKLDVLNMTPMEAMNKLVELKEDYAQN